MVHKVHCKNNSTVTYNCEFAVLHIKASLQCARMCKCTQYVHMDPRMESPCLCTHWPQKLNLQLSSSLIIRMATCQSPTQLSQSNQLPHSLSEQRQKRRNRLQIGSLSRTMHQQSGRRYFRDVRQPCFVKMKGFKEGGTQNNSDYIQTPLFPSFAS